MVSRSIAPPPPQTVADASLRAAKLDDARHALDEALELADRTGEHFYLSELWRIRGELLARTDSPSGAEECLRMAIDIARGQGASLFELRAAIALYELALPPARKSVLHDVLEPALRAFHSEQQAIDARYALTLIAEAPQG